jgi:hypothetical protein
MKNWLSKTGFPLISVEETAKGLKVKQNRFLATADATVRSASSLFARSALTASCRLARGGPDHLARSAPDPRRRPQDWREEGPLRRRPHPARAGDRASRRRQHDLQAQRRDLQCLCVTLTFACLTVAVLTFHTRLIFACPCRPHALPRLAPRKAR